MTRPVVHFEIRAKDRERLQEFYATLFGWNIDSSSSMGLSNIPPGIGGPVEGVGGHIRSAETPGVSIFVQVVDPVETLRKAAEMGLWTSREGPQSRRWPIRRATSSGWSSNSLYSSSRRTISATVSSGVCSLLSTQMPLPAIVSRSVSSR